MYYENGHTNALEMFLEHQISMLVPFRFAGVKLSLKSCSLWAALLKWNSGVWDYYINYRKCTVAELRMSSQCCQGNSQTQEKDFKGEKKQGECHRSRKSWDDRGLDSHLGWFWHVLSFLRVCSLHIPRDQRVPTEHCLHAGIYYDHYRPLMCVFGPAPLYCTCRDYRSEDESAKVIIDGIIL